MVLGKDNGAETSADQTLSREHSALSLLITVGMMSIAAVVAALQNRPIDPAEATILDAIDEDRAQQLADATTGSGLTE
jgi:ferric-dicitrate binding protein FerR (iron transport regulator)